MSGPTDLWWAAKWIRKSARKFTQVIKHSCAVDLWSTGVEFHWVTKRWKPGAQLCTNLSSTKVHIDKSMQVNGWPSKMQVECKKSYGNLASAWFWFSVKMFLHLAFWKKNNLIIPFSEIRWFEIKLPDISCYFYQICPISNIPAKTVQEHNSWYCGYFNMCQKKHCSHSDYTHTHTHTHTHNTTQAHTRTTQAHIHYIQYIHTHRRQVAIMCTHARAACEVWSADGTNTVNLYGSAKM